MAVLTVNV